MTWLKTKQERMASVLTLSQSRVQRSIELVFPGEGNGFCVRMPGKCIRIFYGGVIP